MFLGSFNSENRIFYLFTEETSDLENVHAVTSQSHHRQKRFIGMLLSVFDRVFAVTTYALGVSGDGGTGTLGDVVTGKSDF